MPRKTASTRVAATSSLSGLGDPPLDAERAEALVMELMAIPGQSGEESRVSAFVVDQLRRAGASAEAIQSDQVHRSTPTPGDTGNLVFKLPGTVRGPRRLLAAHLDTVPICVGSRPERKGELVRSADPRTGLGADNRAGVGTILTAALEILERKLPHPPLTFCWFVQEEVGLQGSRQARLGLLGKPKLAFNWDGGSPTKLTVGATGGYRLSIEIEGLASHAGGAPEKGISAIAIAGLAIADLQTNGWHGDIRKGRSCGTSNIGFIQGGAATNVVTDRVVLRAEARSHQGAFRERIVREIRKAFERAAKSVRNDAGRCGSVEFDGRLDYDSFRLADDEPCILAAESAIRGLGQEPLRAIANGGLDANWLSARGIPTVSLGCGQQSPHTVAEALVVNEYLLACRIALSLATGREHANGTG